MRANRCWSNKRLKTQKQLKAYKQRTSKDDFAFILYEPLGTEASDKQILELTGKDAFEVWGRQVKPT